MMRYRSPPRRFPVSFRRHTFEDLFLILSSYLSMRSEQHKAIRTKAKARAIQLLCRAHTASNPPLHSSKNKNKNSLISYRLIDAEPVLDAAIEPERMEMLKEVNRREKHGRERDRERQGRGGGQERREVKRP